MTPYLSMLYERSLDFALVGTPTLFLLFAFSASAVLLGITDVRLHRSGLVGLSAAFDSFALVALGPLFAVALSTLGVATGMLLPGTQTRSVSRLVPARAAGVLLGFAVGSLFLSAPWGPETSLAPRVLTVLCCFWTQTFIILALGLRAESRGFAQFSRSGIESQIPMALAQLSAVLLAVTVFSSMGVWSLVLMMALLLLVRQSYSLLAEVSESYLCTVEVLVEAAEGLESVFRGHAERSASVARKLASRYGLTSSEVQRAGYAALLQAVGGIRDLGDGAALAKASNVIRDIEFFHDVVGVLEVLEGEPRDSGVATSGDEVLALIVAVAQEIDIRQNLLPTSEDSRQTLRRIARRVPGNARFRVISAVRAMGYESPVVFE